MENSNSDTGPAGAPPARLAARLQRRSNSRRRSSAHSSRRSSISSLHSRASTLSCHGGPHSTHIAQHLRRASIIENRKARLAERAAHAEQVRLRAAAAKAVPKSSNSEEKALAAQAAREKLLAEITARCEEEVRRAKRVAEETKERKAAEHAKLRDEMAERHADAAKRRSNYQMNFRRPRTTSLAAVEEKKIGPQDLKSMSQNVAVKVIQRTWRATRPRRIARAFMKAGISVEDLKKMDFEDVTKLISSEATMAASMRLVKHLGILDHETDENARRGAIRVFLGAFMVVAHPVEAFSHGGKEPQEQDLITKGQVLVTAVEAAVASLVEDQQTPATVDGLQQLFNDFTSGFHAWKTQDLGILADVMIGSFVNLDLIIQSTKDDRDGNVAEEYLQAIRTEQTKILVRLKRLIGHDKAMDRIRKAVRKARRDRVAQQAKESTEHVPRASTPVDMDVDIAPSALLTPPATPSREVQRSEEASSFVNRLGLTMTVLPPNREIAHEIQINGTYEVQQQPWTDSRKDLMDALRRGMRDSIQQGGTHAESAWTHSMVILVKDKIMNLISQRHPLYDKIDTFLDARLIEQQVQKGMFVYNDFFTTIANMIKQICSPGRDDIVQQFSDATSSDTIERLFSLINILDIMTLDHINFQFRLASKSVIEHGHEHEHSMFEQDLKGRVHGLEHTKLWWNNARRGISGANPGTFAYANAVYARALTDLVFSNTPLTYEHFPETLRLDYIRLLKVRARTFHVVAVASTLLTSKIRLRRNREALWSKEAERLMKLDVLSTDVATIVRQIESGHMMPDSTKSGLIDFVSRVLPIASGAASKLKTAEQERQEAIQERREYDPARGQAEADKSDVFGEQIATFILKSLKEHFFYRIAASSTAEKVRVTSGASETLARIGMPEFVSEAGGIVDVLERVKNVDLKAHEKWYDQIATESNEATVS
ncbi:hypothetical protein PMZ80_003908 [Knufia obscura]|uniref:Uncharacterized protein n=1 Tax=Knufia obscura TaxID=1635080 RepID=A0ABR0RVM2_9EURO|nr:hypothetical protein PMZ80_003908 [Knufia obscura]